MLVATALALILAAEPETAAAPASPPAVPASPTWSFGFDRVDLLSEEVGTFLNYDVLELPLYPLKPVVRFVEQVKVVFRLPWKGLFFSGGLVTRLLFPRGAIAGVAYRTGLFRFGLSVSAFTSGSWSAPGSFQLSVFPSLGVGIGIPAS